MNITFIKSSRILSMALLSFAIAAPLYAQQIESNNSAQAAQVNDGYSAAGSKTVKKTDAAGDAKAAPAPSFTYNWTGGYIGGHVGYGWGKADTHFEPLPSAVAFGALQPTTLSLSPRGVTGGVQGGYNWQTGHFVLGGEADFSASDIKKAVTVSPITQNSGTPFPGAGFLASSQKMKWFGTLRPRAGVAFDRVFIYGTAGLAYGHVDYSANTDFRPTGTVQYPAAFSKTKTGWTAGGGAEIAINKHISVKAEYLYYDLGNVSLLANPTPALPPYQIQYNWQTKGNIFNTGVNFRF
jgi:outer membrane immunogenic protein